MCTMVFAWDSHPRYRFVFAGNRDELHARPTRAADWWPQRQLLGGQDLLAGGTWLGTTEEGRFAVVSNFREGSQATSGARSRGDLVTGFLRADYEADLFREQLDEIAPQYSGYNLIYGDLRTALYYQSNRGQSVGLAPGIHGLSNHLLDTPWPKVVRSTERLTELLNDPVIQCNSLIDLLSDRQSAPDAELPDTGIGLELERLLSSAFIVSPTYGTRSSTAILLDHNGRLQFVERRFDATGTETGESRFEYLVV